MDGTLSTSSSFDISGMTNGTHTITFTATDKYDSSKKDISKYEAIGESDRMTLLFKK